MDAKTINDQPSTLKPWLGAILSKFVSGLFHGSIVGSGTIVAADSAQGNAPTGHGILWAAGISAVIGAVKDVGFYISANPMPNIFQQPTIAPIAGPVAPPTVSDQPATLTQPTATIKP